MALNKKLFLGSITCIVVLSYFWSGLKDNQPAEDLEVVTGFGVDILKSGNNQIIYSSPIVVYTFEEGDKISSTVKNGLGLSPAKTRENRQLISNKQYILGLEKIYLYSEERASEGILNPIEAHFRNPYTNDNGYVAISHYKPEEIFNLKIAGYPSSADYIDGMIKNARYYNFFSTFYKISDVFLILDSEGRNVILPCIDIDNIDNSLKITGLYIFKKDKMIEKLNIEESKILNILSGTNGKGVISFSLNASQSLECYSKVKRKVKVTKLGETYQYTIDLNFTCDIVSDSIYNENETNTSTYSEIETKLAENIKKSCNDLIYKLKNQYKVDSLQLGQYAAAKYGRNKSIDWDEVFTKSTIKVNVQVKIDRNGRGNYYLKTNKK
jgi:Ger(x)C family germination protein